jgi:hypothetical protein
VSFSAIFRISSREIFSLAIELRKVHGSLVM